MGFGIDQAHDSTPSYRANTTALVYYSISFKSTCRQKGTITCTNRADQSRIILQTEQLPSAGPIKRHLQECHQLPLCVVWDWSECNWNLVNRTLGVADSMIILPTMFRDRFDKIYSRMNGETLPLAGRFIDIAFLERELVDASLSTTVSLPSTTTPPREATSHTVW